MTLDLDDTTTTLVLKPDLPQAYPVLIVDDDELVRLRLVDLLEEAGYKTHTAGTAREALELLAKTYCPIVVTDWQMPDMDGLSLCKALRTREFPGYVYIILLTVRTDSDDVLQGLTAGADDYVSKAASLDELLARLRAGRRVINLEQSLRRANNKNRALAHTDALTGVFNRRHLTKALPRECERSRRYGRPLSVLSFDVDHFKQINDRFGHDVGDEVLKALVARAQGAMRMNTDWLTRTGGEEFLLVMPETTLEAAASAAERLRAHLAATPFTTSAGAISITVSVGVSAMPEPPEATPMSCEDLLLLADRGLYASKHGGRDRVTVMRSTGPDGRATVATPAPGLRPH